MASGLGNRPDPPSYDEVTKGRESEVGASDVTHPGIFTVVDSRHGSAKDAVIQDVKPVVVDSLPFQSYEFEEVKQHYIGTESDSPWFFPEKLYLLLCLLNCIGFFGYLLMKKESMQNFRTGKSAEAWIYYFLAQFFLFLILAAPVGIIIAMIIIHV